LPAPRKPSLNEDSCRNIPFIVTRTKTDESGFSA
jgi:hypothetical protein